MKLNIDPSTGEIISAPVTVKANSVPAIIIDVSEVATYHTAPLDLAKKIEDQAGYAVFDVSTKKGRDECRSHAANIIKCIAPAAKESQRLAEKAKAVVKQDLTFRKVFDERVREIAAFHRQPLTEYEAEQERLEELAKALEQKRLDEEKYLSAWDAALEYDELLKFRKAKELADSIAFKEQCEREEKERFEAELAQRLEQERAQIQREEEAKALAKFKAEQDRIDAEKQDAIEKERTQAEFLAQVALNKEAEHIRDIEDAQLSANQALDAYLGIDNFYTNAEKERKAQEPVISEILVSAIRDRDDLANIDLDDVGCQIISTREKIILLVALEFRLIPETAERWLISIFSK